MGAEKAQGLTTGNIVALVIGAVLLAIAVVLCIRFREKIKKFLRVYKSELKKVVWPSTQTLTNNTAITLFVTILAAVILWGFDSLAQMAVKALITLAG